MKKVLPQDAAIVQQGHGAPLFDAGPWARIPEPLKKVKRWGPWYARKIPGVDKLAKVPDKATSKPETWLPFEDVVTIVKNNPKIWAGLGFVMTKCKGFVGLDLDRCVKDRIIAPWALALIKRANTYTEYSPSGTGIRMFLRGDAPQDFLNQKAGIELYAGHSGRYLTVTGDQVEGTPNDLNEANDLVLELIKEYGTKPAVQATTSPPDLPDVGPTPDIPFLQTGASGSDRSRSLFSAACQLAKSYTDPEVLAHLCNSPYAWALAEEHRPRATEEGTDAAAMQYLWQQVAAARGKVGELGGGFDDLRVEQPGEQYDGKGWAEPDYSLRVQKATEYLIEGFWAHSMAILAGLPGIGKTTVLLALCMVMAGFDLGSGLKARKRRKIVYVTEDTGQIEDILFAYCKLKGLDPDAVRSMFILVPARRAELPDLLTLRYNTHRHTVDGVRPLLVLDTLAATMAIENENDNAQASAFVNGLKVKFFETDKTPVVVNAHTTKATGRNDEDGVPRGAGSFMGDPTLLLAVFALKDDPDARCLRIVKSRYTPSIYEVVVDTQVHTEHIVVDADYTQAKPTRVGFPRPSSKSAREAAEKLSQLEQDCADVIEFLHGVKKPVSQNYVVEYGSVPEKRTRAACKALKAQKLIYETEAGLVPTKGEGVF